MSKKKLIRVEKAEGLGSIYDSSNLGSGGATCLGFVGKEEKIVEGIKYRKQISNFVSCRETFCSIPRYAVNPKLCEVRGDIANFNPKIHQFDFDNFRLLIGNANNDRAIKERFFSAKRIINILEEEAGWKDRSVITTVKHTTYKDSENVFLFTGPKEWIISPQMVSLAVLLLRIPVSVIASYEATTYKELQQEFNRISKTNHNRDTVFLSEIRKKIMKVMKNVNEIFTDDPKQNWPENDRKFMGYGGINTLFKCNTGDEELNNRFKQIVLS